MQNRVLPIALVSMISLSCSNSENGNSQNSVLSTIKLPSGFYQHGENLPSKLEFYKPTTHWSVPFSILLDGVFQNGELVKFADGDIGSVQLGVYLTSRRTAEIRKSMIDKFPKQIADMDRYQFRGINSTSLASFDCVGFTFIRHEIDTWSRFLLDVYSADYKDGSIWIAIGYTGFSDRENKPLVEAMIRAIEVK